MAKAAIRQGQMEFGKDRCQYRHNQSLFLLTVAVVMLMMKVMIYLLTTHPRYFSHTNGTK